jgi:hypothetical protein
MMSFFLPHFSLRHDVGQRLNGQKITLNSKDFDTTYVSCNPSVWFSLIFNRSNGQEMSKALGPAWHLANMHSSQYRVKFIQILC